MLLALAAVLLSAGCEQPEAPAPADDQLAEKRAQFYRERAKKLGAYHGRMVRLLAEDMAKLDPRSDRAEASREAKELLEEIVPRETKEDEAPR